MSDSPPGGRRGDRSGRISAALSDSRVPALYLGKAVSSDDRDAPASALAMPGSGRASDRCDTDRSLPVSRRSGSLVRPLHRRLELPLPDSMGREIVRRQRDCSWVARRTNAAASKLWALRLAWQRPVGRRRDRPAADECDRDARATATAIRAVAQSPMSTRRAAAGASLEAGVQGRARRDAPKAINPVTSQNLTERQQLKLAEQVTGVERLRRRRRRRGYLSRRRLAALSRNGSGRDADDAVV